MRASGRLLAAAAARSAQFLTPHQPTGLTGLFTHPAPRPRLIYLYNSTLEKLKQFPESSVYRQSTEALTKHRLSVIESHLPEGYEAWSQRVREELDKNPHIFTFDGGAVRRKVGSQEYVVQTRAAEYDERDVAWDGEEPIERIEGPLPEEDRINQARDFGAGRPTEQLVTPDFQLEDEPPLTVDQINDIETKIGGGLIEEVIAVAEGEDRLADVMLKNKVWEELEDKPVEGQWKYFERGATTGD